MKKLLGILSVIGLVSVPATMVVGCGTNSKPNNNGGNTDNGGDKPEVGIKTLTFNNVKNENGETSVKLTFNLANEQDKRLYNLLVALQDKENKGEIKIDNFISDKYFMDGDVLVFSILTSSENGEVGRFALKTRNDVIDSNQSLTNFMIVNNIDFHDDELKDELIKEKLIFDSSSIDGVLTWNLNLLTFLSAFAKENNIPASGQMTEQQQQIFLKAMEEHQKEFNYSDDFKIEVENNDNDNGTKVPDKKISLMK